MSTRAGKLQKLCRRHGSKQESDISQTATATTNKNITNYLLVMLTALPFSALQGQLGVAERGHHEGRGQGGQGEGAQGVPGNQVRNRESRGGKGA